MEIDPMKPTTISRRHWLLGGTAATCVGTPFIALGSNDVSQIKRVAAVVTIYRKNSHADVLVGKILEGWKQDGGAGPALQLVSMYVDQFPSDDMSIALSKKYGFRICSSIRQALELDSNELAVDGVLSIGEHGDYPVNEIGQQLYPRRRFFEEITNVFERSGRCVPVFNDKHPGPQRGDALWMYERAKKLNVPWMAGSSLTVGARNPDITLPVGETVASCIAVGYSGLDIYGFHTLDFLQSIVERRATKQQSVHSVRAVPVDRLRTLIQEGIVDEAILSMALESSGTTRAKLESIASHMKKDRSAIFLVQYADGLLVPVFMLDSAAQGISVACKTRNGQMFSTRAEEFAEPRYPHFANLLKGIEQMIWTGKPAYPVERTLLAACVLDGALTSLNRAGESIELSQLPLNYSPVDYPHAPHIDLMRRFANS